VIRSGLVESVHEVDVAVVDAQGVVVASAGDPDRTLFARSSMKPLQATVSLSLCSFDWTDREIAVMCASHNAEPIHVETVRSMLARTGLSESALQCPPRRPWDEEAAAAAPEPLAINSDCSGKHTGMLAACVTQGWPTETYLQPDHPYQQAVLRAVVRAAGIDNVPVGVDGCGAPVHGFRLRDMAAVYGTLAMPEGLGELEAPARRAVGAMAAEPYMVAGRDRVDTAVMEAAPGVVVKAGAEGLLCAALLGRGVGVAVRVRDGSSRPTGPVLIEALRQLGALDPGRVEQLEPFARPKVLGGGSPVGELVTELSFDA
jgi:L-asparaginase II